MGEQPRTDTHIECLECGRWLRSMSTHLARAHDMTAEQYKLTHGLLMSEPLAAPDLVSAGVERGKRLAQRSPGVQAIITGQHRRLTTEEASRLHARRAEHVEYAQARSARLPRTTPAAVIEHRDTLARDAGYPSWARFIMGTLGLSGIEAGRLIGVSETAILDGRRQIIGDDWNTRRLHYPSSEAAARAAGYRSFDDAIEQTAALSQQAAATLIGVAKTTVATARRRASLASRPRLPAEHGTDAMWRQGCRCDDCSKAHTREETDRRHRRALRRLAPHRTAILDRLAAGIPPRDAVADTGITLADIYGIASWSDEWRAAMDTAQIAGRSPDIAHGTAIGYKNGCRCPDCRAAHHGHGGTDRSTQKVQAHGYQSVADAIDQTRHLSPRAAAKQTGLSAPTITRRRLTGKAGAGEDSGGV